MQAGYGYYSPDGLTPQECPPGTYGIAAGAPTLAQGCAPCATGSVAAGYANRACTPCLPPLVASADATQCTAGCGAGAYYVNGACKQCPAGFTRFLQLAHDPLVGPATD